MDFKEFILLSEISQIIDEPLTDIELQPYDKGYIYNFIFDEKNYKVAFELHPLKVWHNQEPHFITENAYEIGFFGPKGKALAHTGYGNTIYTKMLKGVLKFLHQVKPEGLYFEGSEPAMSLIYDKFLKILGKTPETRFIRLDDKNYINEYFYLNKLNPRLKRIVDEMIQTWKSQEQNYLNTLKQERRMKSQIKEGDFVRINRNEFGLVLHINKDQIVPLVFSKGEIDEEQIILNANQVQKVEPLQIPFIEKFLQELFQSYYFRRLPPEIQQKLRNI